MKQSLVSKQKHSHRLFIYCLTIAGLLALSAIFASSQVTAQDEGDQTEEAKSADNPDADKQPVKPEEEKPKKKTLYFIGPKFTSERQQGPSIGVPISILPKPLVVKGSVPVPAPEEGASKENALSGEGGVPGQKADGLDDIDRIVDRAQLPGYADGLPSPGAEETPSNQSVADGANGIQEGSLERIDPSGLAVQGLANPIDTVWQGYDRADIKLFLERLAQPSFSPTLTRFASSIAGSGFSLPAPSNQDDIIQIIEARLAVFAATANTSAYVSLLEGLPSDGDWSALSRHIARAHLLKSELTDTCLIAEAERVKDADPYWLRLAAFCMAATGNRFGVDFQLGILEETTVLEPVFYQLLDQILVEAEQPPGALLSERIAIDGALQADILTVAMARLARAKVSAVAAKDLNPLSIPLLLENPSLSIEAQSMLIAYLIERGIGGGDAMAAFARSITLQEGEAQLALTLSAQADQSVADVGAEGAVLAAGKPEADVDVQVVGDNRLQTTLLALIAGAGTDAQKIPALNYFWQRAGDGGKQAAVAPVLTALLPPGGFGDAGQITPDVRAKLARSATLSGDDRTANGWSRGLRTSVAGQNPAVDEALIALWPLIALGEDHLAVDSANRLTLWWQQQAKSPEASGRANLLYSLTDAAGGNVPEALWLELAEGPTAFDGVTISPALWRKFETNVQAEDPLAALSSLYQLLSEVSPADLPAAISGVLVSGLRRLGFEETALALALEILISQKL